MQSLCNHTIIDKDFTPDDIQMYYRSLECALYISVICVNKYHRGIVTVLLFNKLTKLIRKKIKMGCKFTEVIAEACTIEGKKLLLKLGFIRLDAKSQLPAIFKLSIDEFLINTDEWFKYWQCFI